MRTSETPASPLHRTIDPAEYLRPIEFIRRDHEQQRSFCERLDTLIDDLHQLGYQELAASLLEFAISDLPRCMEDEEGLLAPALMVCCAPEEDPKEIVSELLHQHQAAATLAAQTVDGLDRLAAGVPPSKPLDFIVSALQLAEILRRCADWEDGVLLPLAASRLTDEDQKSLGSSMARRHGMGLPLSNCA
jgi:hypothetical protein